MLTQNKYPIYIVSKGRWESRLTMKSLEQMGLSYFVIVEEQEREQYAAVLDRKLATILTLDPTYQRDYDVFAPTPGVTSTGSGPARNFAWDHAEANGDARHWVVDDNIGGFFRLNDNLKVPVKTGAFFRSMEDFVDRYENVAMAGPHYFRFVPRKDVHPPFIINTRVYSCNLIQTDASFRWRGRYNEDTDLSLRMLKAGWCTVLFNALLQNKSDTQKMKGGNTDSIYTIGTLEKSRMLVNMHPDVARLVWKWNRWHHHVDYRRFKRNQLKLKPGIDLSTMEPNEYGMKLVNVHTREPIPTPALHKVAD